MFIYIITFSSGESADVYDDIYAGGGYKIPVKNMTVKRWSCSSQQIDQNFNEGDHELVTCVTMLSLNIVTYLPTYNHFPLYFHGFPVNDEVSEADTTVDHRSVTLNLTAKD